MLNAQAYLKDAHQSITGLFHKAWKLGTEEDRKKLQQASDNFEETLEKGRGVPSAQSVAITGMVNDLSNIHPVLYEEIEDYALSKSANTFSNVAFDAFQKYGDKAPTINIENIFAGGMAYSYGEELDNLIKETKKQFVQKATDKGFSEGVAETQADKMIGVTFDVGHLNIAKKRGFEDKDLIKEMDAIAKHVKHVHLTDNFGYSDSHLAPGMGNVPIKEMMERLEKEGYEGNKIVEVGGFVQQFETSPLPYTLEGMGSPMYTGRTGPYWNQVVGLQQSYFGGFGEMLPQVNYQVMGAGFSQLPAELGGQAAGGRVSGRPME